MSHFAVFMAGVCAASALWGWAHGRPRWQGEVGWTAVFLAMAVWLP